MHAEIELAYSCDDAIRKLGVDEYVRLAEALPALDLPTFPPPEKWRGVDWDKRRHLIDLRTTGVVLAELGVRFDPSGAVSRVEVMVYREAYGGEVRSERFLKQFIGKKAGDPILAGKDIDIISGATYSSKSMALGVKRDVLILDAARKNGSL